MCKHCSLIYLWFTSSLWSWCFASLPGNRPTLTGPFVKVKKSTFSYSFCGSVNTAKCLRWRNSMWIQCDRFSRAHSGLGAGGLRVSVLKFAIFRSYYMAKPGDKYEVVTSFFPIFNDCQTFLFINLGFLLFIVKVNRPTTKAHEVLVHAAGPCPGQHCATQLPVYASPERHGRVCSVKMSPPQQTVSLTWDIAELKMHRYSMQRIVFAWKTTLLILLVLPPPCLFSRKSQKHLVILLKHYGLVKPSGCQALGFCWSSKPSLYIIFVQRNAGLQLLGGGGPPMGNCPCSLRRS